MPLPRDRYPALLQPEQHLDNMLLAERTEARRVACEQYTRANRLERERNKATDQTEAWIKRYYRLEEEKRELVEALKSLLAMAKHYKPIPKGYNPLDEDEETWGIGQIYKEAEKALAKVEGE